MSDQLVFDDESKEPKSDPFTDQLKNITDPDGRQKYESTEKALEALNHSQQFIEQLKKEKSEQQAELERVREEMKTMGTVEDIISRYTDQKPQDAPKTEGVSEDAVRQLVQNALKEKETISQKQANLTSVVNTLQEKFGDKANEAVKMKAKELGTTPEQLKALAAEQPKLVTDLFSSFQIDSVPPAKGTQISNPPRQDKNEKPTFEHSLVQGGASSTEMVDAWKKIKEYTYKELGVQT